MKCLSFLALAASSVLGCSDPSIAAPSPTCDPRTEVEIAHVENGSRDSGRCIEIPAACLRDDPCAYDVCRAELYGSCDEGWIGVACSEDPGAALIVSCNR